LIKVGSSKFFSTTKGLTLITGTSGQGKTLYTFNLINSLSEIVGNTNVLYVTNCIMETDLKKMSNLISVDNVRLSALLAESSVAGNKLVTMMDAFQIMEDEGQKTDVIVFDGFNQGMPVGYSHRGHKVVDAVTAVKNFLKKHEDLRMFATFHLPNKQSAHTVEALADLGTLAKSVIRVHSNNGYVTALCQKGDKEDAGSILSYRVNKNMCFEQ